MRSEWQRRVDLDGCLNFRDLGGYPTADGGTVRLGQVFRSDALHRLSARDVARLRNQIGLGDIVDLRSTAELRSEGRGLLANEPIRFHHLPLFDREIREQRDQAQQLSLADRYSLLAEFAMGPIARVITTVAATTAPAVYHCAAGKDRTGVISALILGLLGVEDAVIVADYALTQETLDQIIDRLMATDGYQTMLNALPPDTMHARPETMVALLEKLRARYGSVRGYARAAGITEDTIQRLNRRLVE